MVSHIRFLTRQYKYKCGYMPYWFLLIFSHWVLKEFSMAYYYKVSPEFFPRGFWRSFQFAIYIWRIDQEGVLRNKNMWSIVWERCLPWGVCWGRGVSPTHPFTMYISGSPKLQWNEWIIWTLHVSLLLSLYNTNNTRPYLRMPRGAGSSQKANVSYRFACVAVGVWVEPVSQLSCTSFKPGPQWCNSLSALGGFWPGVWTQALWRLFCHADGVPDGSPTDSAPFMSLHESYHIPSSNKSRHRLSSEAICVSFMTPAGDKTRAMAMHHLSTCAISGSGVLV